MIKYMVSGIAIDDEHLDRRRHPRGRLVRRLPVARLHPTSTCASVAAQLIDRRVRDEWQGDGATDLYMRSLAKAREILEHHVPEPLDADIAKEMRAFVLKADQERGVG